MYLALADLHNWTPDQVDALDPDFVTHLITRQNAQADHRNEEDAKAKKKREREAKLERLRKAHRG